MKYYILFTILILITSCKTELKKEVLNQVGPAKEYTLVSDDDHILVEQFDSLHTDANKYNHNNTVFKVGTSFTYDFVHKNVNEEIFYFKRDQNDWKKWFFIPENKKDSTTITSVVITVVNGNPMADRMPDYNQTVIKYQLTNSNSYSTSGVIENEGNLWMHPPREAYFRILELNPFPYIKAPYKVGNTWTWDLIIGSNWGDDRWKTWEGSITNEYTYKIIDKKTIPTALGALDCYIITGEATSILGTTYLKAYFNEIYGFVILDYTNIDGSKTLLELTAHTN